MFLLSGASLLVLASAVAAPASTDMGDIEEIQVIAYPVMVDNTGTPVEAPPAADGADYLRSIPGVSAGRFGGHSLEPFIRGMSQSQLTVLHDGALQMGSGPNRMDTPSTYATIDLIDRVVVYRGYQSVLNGPGAVGGTILYERDIPVYEEDLWFKAKVGTAYESNGGVERAFGRASAGKGNLAIEGWYSIHKADNYEDGSGKEVRSAFNDKAAGTSLTWLDQDGSYLQLTYSWNKMTDALFPGAGMDSVLSGGDTITLKSSFVDFGGFLEEVRVTASWADTEHVMNNFTHRMNMGMMMESRTGSETYNGEIELDFPLGGSLATLAFNIRDITNDGARYTGMMPNKLDMTSTILWPGINTRQYGIALEQKRELGSDISLTLGARSDWTKISFSKADNVPMMGMMNMPAMSANMLYRTYYGYGATDTNEHLLSGLAKLEWEPSLGTVYYAGISRSGRTADATERGMANRMMMNGMNSSWIGNPALEPEKHTQLEIGFLKASANWSFGLSAFIDSVEDYILRDSARGQDGVLVNAPMADVYRNVSARLMGFEAQAQWQATDKISFNADLAYSWGKDRDRDAPLPQIPPLQGSFSANYDLAPVGLTAIVRFADKQSRVDLNPMMGTGRDVRETPGYAVVDFTAQYAITDNIRLQGGVRNLFDKQYADHLSRSNLLDATEVQVNEPGRNAFIKLTAEF